MSSTWAVCCATFLYGLYDGLTDNAINSLLCMDAWFPVGETIWEGLEVVALLEKVCHWSRPRGF